MDVNHNLDRVTGRWPSPPTAEAFHGLVGDFMRLVEPHTEADTAALLISLLVAFGNVIGRSAHFRAEADRHYTNLFGVLVGQSSKARKGSSFGQIRRALELIDPYWASDRIQSGLSSGEGLIWAVRDPRERQQPIREGKEITDYQIVVDDEGVTDKRLFCVEGELASLLQVMRREGNTMSATLRNAWDSGKLQSLTKSAPGKATNAHISLLGHITNNELLRYFSTTEAGNGFGNRILWACAGRSKYLPDGGNLCPADLVAFVERLRETVRFAAQVGEMQRDEEAKMMWHEVYPSLSCGKPGLLGAMIARAEAQTMRIACLYALLDHSEVIRSRHLKAALAVWKYCEDSAYCIFGDALGDPVADTIYQALRAVAPEGLTRTELHQLFGRNKAVHEIGRALVLLQEQQKARVVRTGGTVGRTAEMWYAM